ncbi:AMP-binding protein [Spirillospora sp. CA-294931]|uniref:AMP-binding protein n=1 Tax=Spirillospora sp. CA-294931 TaxID=3240042 RepID=UPI003D91E497
MIPIGPGPVGTAPPMTVTQAVFGTVGADPERNGRPAVVDATTGRGYTYAELGEAVGSAAAGLAREGVGPGTVVALHIPDSPEYVIALHAVMAAGAVALPLRATLPGTELTRLLAEAGARMLITWPVVLDVAQEAAKGAGVDRVVCFGDEPDVEPFSSLLAGGAAPDIGLDPQSATALLACTRGSSGPARLVPLSHAEVASALIRAAEAGLLGPSDTALTAVSSADVLGMNGLLNAALRLGATVVTCASAGRHDLLRALQDHRVTAALLAPRLVETLAYDRAVPRYRLRSLRTIVSTGGPLRAEAARACAARIGCPVRQAYGLAEAAGLTHVNLRAAEEGTLDSVGRGLSGLSWRVIDIARGTDQPAYQGGELCVRLPAGADAAPGHIRWLPTGDSAFADEHGRVYILGRLDSAAPEPPAEPDAVLSAHPAVSEAVLVPVPDAELGLAPHAFAVLAEPADAAELLDYINGHARPFAGVLAVHVVDMIPRSPSGRVLRRALLERAGLGS